MRSLPPALFSGDNESANIVLPIGQICVRVRSSPRRNGNEDAAAVIPIADDTLVLAVADGVGGAPGGRDAANLVLGGMIEALRTEGHAVRPGIVTALERANAELLGGGRGSATTLAATAITGRSVHTFHVGDSEVLVCGQRGKLRHRVVPHSPTGFAVYAGILNEDEALHHDYRHILLNVVGAPQMRVEVEGAVRLHVLDTVLVATDGVLDNLYLAEIVEIIRSGPLAAAADSLVDRAHGRMMGVDPALPSKPDDLAIILYRRTPRPRRRKAAAAKQSE